MLPKMTPTILFQKKVVLNFLSTNSVQRCLTKHCRNFAPGNRLYWKTRHELFWQKSYPKHRQNWHSKSSSKKNRKKMLHKKSSKKRNQRTTEVKCLSKSNSTEKLPKTPLYIVIDRKAYRNARQKVPITKNCPKNRQSFSFRRKPYWSSCQ